VVQRQIIVPRIIVAADHALSGAIVGTTWHRP